MVLEVEESGVLYIEIKVHLGDMLSVVVFLPSYLSSCSIQYEAPLGVCDPVSYKPLTSSSEVNKLAPLQETWTHSDFRASHPRESTLHVSKSHDHRAIFPRHIIRVLR